MRRNAFFILRWKVTKNPSCEYTILVFELWEHNVHNPRRSHSCVTSLINFSGFSRNFSNPLSVQLEVVKISKDWVNPFVRIMHALNVFRPFSRVPPPKTDLNVHEKKNIQKPLATLNEFTPNLNRPLFENRLELILLGGTRASVGTPTGVRSLVRCRNVLPLCRSLRTSTRMYLYDENFFENFITRVVLVIFSKQTYA